MLKATRNLEQRGYGTQYRTRSRQNGLGIFPRASQVAPRVIQNTSRISNDATARLTSQTESAFGISVSASAQGRFAVTVAI